MSRVLFIYWFMFSATLCNVSHCHLQDEMMMKGFNQWISFRVDKNYAADCQQFSSGQHGCRAVDVSTVITRDSDDG
jgi:hypothetical protein